MTVEAGPAQLDPAVEMARAGLSDRLSRGLTFLTYLIVAQLIAPRAAGQLAAGQVLVGFGFVFAESGMLAALIHWKGDIDRAASTATASTLVSGVLLMLLGLATAPLIGYFFHSSTIGWVAAASSGLLLLRSVQIVPDALLQRRFAFVRRVTVDPLGAAANLVVAVAACAAGLGVWGLLLGQYGLYLTQAIAAWALLKWRPQRHLMSLATWRELAHYARHVVVSEVVRRSTAQLDSILLGRLSGSTALGQYAYGIRIANTPTDAWVSVASFALLPAFARMADDLARFRRAFMEALGAMATVGLPIAVVLITTGDELALTLFGPEWSRSGVAIQALAGVGIGQMLTSIASETYKAAGRPELLIRTHLLTTVTSLIALPTLVVAFDDDVLGIALALSLVSINTGLYAIRTAAKIVEAPLATLARSLWGLLVGALLALGAALAVEALVLPADPGRLDAAVAAASIATLVAVIYAVAVRVLAPDHFARIATMVGRLRRRRQDPT